MESDLWEDGLAAILFLKNSKRERFGSSGGLRGFCKTFEDKHSVISSFKAFAASSALKVCKKLSVKEVYVKLRIKRCTYSLVSVSKYAIREEKKENNDAGQIHRC